MKFIIQYNERPSKKAEALLGLWLTFSVEDQGLGFLVEGFRASMLKKEATNLDESGGWLEDA